MKKTYPHVEFLLNLEMDKFYGLEYLNSQRKSLDLNEFSFFKDALKYTSKQQNEFFSNKVQEYYSINKNRLKNGKNYFQSEWNLVEEEFAGNVEIIAKGLASKLVELFLICSN